MQPWKFLSFALHSVHFLIISWGLCKQLFFRKSKFQKGADNCQLSILTHFRPMFCFHISRKKNGFLVFSGGIEGEQWSEMD